MPGILYVVATPIGNLEDVTLRALRILREVTLIAAEDTRRTAKLLQHYSISTPTTSLHEHNEHARTPALVRRLLAGESIALVSDAGTPGVSDPGTTLVAAAHEAGIPVQPVPGPSAVIAAVSAAGFAGDGFVFAGFPPSRSNHRKKWLRELAAELRPVVFYEAPHRIAATLADIATEIGSRRVAVGRELTKVHEILAVRPINTWIEAPPRPQGEFVLVLAPADPGDESSDGVSDPAILVREFGQLANKSGLSRRGAMRQVAVRHGVSVRTVFDAIERAKNSAD
jgi:16S rRNA (cytidine1402-2'-O)-methyltransferase